MTAEAELIETDTLQDAEQLEGTKHQFLSFSVDDTQYGVNLIDIQEIRVWSETTAIPNTPSYMRGVINLRGRVIPIFDLRARFDQSMTQTTPTHVIIVLSAGERVIGVLVDAVSDIISAHDSEIKPPPSAQDNSPEEGYVRGLLAQEDSMIVLLDVNELFHSDALDAAMNVTTEPDKEEA